jgi:hypothetical protein
MSRTEEDYEAEVAELVRQRQRTQRRPYVGEGADGYRRSAQIDREELDSLDHRDPVDLHRGRVIAVSAAAWERLAEEAEQHGA